MKSSALTTVCALGFTALSLSALLSESPAQGNRPPPASIPEHYKVVGLADDDPAALESKLNKLGAEGWRLRASFTADQFRGLIFAKP